MSLSKVKKSIMAASKEIKVEPSELTMVKYFATSVCLPEWEIRKVGGYKAVHDLLYPKPELFESEITGSKIIKNFRNKLAGKANVDEALKNEFLKTFKEVIAKTPIVVKSASKVSPKKKVRSRTIVAHISDTHIGANIESSEMGGVNAFTPEITSRRFALFAEQVVTYKPQYRKDTDLVICINGDIIAGMIHDQEFFADLLTQQTAAALKILIQFVSYCAGYYENVKVVMTSGNHGRAMHKGNKSRATTHKWDSYETMIYLGVKYAVEAKCKNVKCEIPTTPYAILDIQGHKFLQTHGDTVVNVGNPGKNISIAQINNQVNKLNASNLTDGKFAGIIVGHVHTPTVHLADNGAFLLINGTLSGADPFCQSIGIFSNQPTQMMFEVTKEYSVGDIRFIRLHDADNDARLDKIIEPMKGHLE